MKAIVTEIQVGGFRTVSNLRDACEEYTSMFLGKGTVPFRTKIHFEIALPSGIRKVITIRDEDNQTVAYGDFEGLPSFLDYAKEVMGEEE